MQDPTNRKALIDYYDAPGKNLFNGGLLFNIGKLILNKTRVEGQQKYVDMTCADIAKQLGVHPVEAFVDLSIEDNLEVEWRTTVKPSNVQELKMVANGEYCIPGVSDGGAHTKFITAGDYSTDFLTNLVRDADGMTLEDAHWRLSSYAAKASGMLDRGHLSVGMPADVLVYDYKNLRSMPEEIAYDFPGGEWRRIKRAEGYDYTVVNGVVTFEGNRC